MYNIPSVNITQRETERERERERVENKQASGNKWPSKISE